MTQQTKLRGQRTLAGLLAIGIVTAVAVVGASPVNAATTTLTPTSLVSTKGSIAAGQSVSNLAVKDQSGTADTFSKYVEFDTTSTGYAGYRQYSVPSSTAPSSVTGISVAANYKGPTNAEQKWTWALYNWSTSSWTSVGTNVGTSSWVWKSLAFASPASASSYVSSAGAVRVQLSSTRSSTTRRSPCRPGRPLGTPPLRRFRLQSRLRASRPTQLTCRGQGRQTTWVSRATKSS